MTRLCTYALLLTALALLACAILGAAAGMLARLPL